MKINLKQKKLKNGKSGLFLEFYNGYRIDKNEVKKHLRKFEYLKQYVFDNPKDADENRKNKETLLLVENILAIRKAEYIQGKFKIKNDKKGEVTFLDYYNRLKEDRFETKVNYGNWDAAQKHIEKYCPPHKQLKDIDTDFVEGFKRYLNTKAKTKSSILPIRFLLPARGGQVRLSAGLLQKSDRIHAQSLGVRIWGGSPKTHKFHKMKINYHICNLIYIFTF